VCELLQACEWTHNHLTIPSSTVGPESNESAKVVAIDHIYDTRFFAHRWLRSFPLSLRRPPSVHGMPSLLGDD
jgi:hypothetical protein